MHGKNSTIFMSTSRSGGLAGRARAAASTSIALRKLFVVGADDVPLAPPDGAVPPHQLLEKGPWTFWSVTKSRHYKSARSGTAVAQSKEVMALEPWRPRATFRKCVLEVHLPKTNEADGFQGRLAKWGWTR